MHRQVKTSQGRAGHLHLIPKDLSPFRSLKGARKKQLIFSLRNTGCRAIYPGGKRNTSTSSQTDRFSDTSADTSRRQAPSSRKNGQFTKGRTGFENKGKPPPERPSTSESPFQPAVWVDAFRNESSADFSRQESGKAVQSGSSRSRESDRGSEVFSASQPRARPRQPSAETRWQQPEEPVSENWQPGFQQGPPIGQEARVLRASALQRPQDVRRQGQTITGLPVNDQIDSNAGRLGQTGRHEEQPGPSGRGKAASDAPLRNIFRGRNLQFWSRNDQNAEDGSSRSSRRPSDVQQGRQPASSKRTGPAEDDWAANEVVLREDDDGWGGSYVNKQTAQPSRAAPPLRSQTGAYQGLGNSKSNSPQEGQEEPAGGKSSRYDEGAARAEFRQSEQEQGFSAGSGGFQAEAEASERDEEQAVSGDPQMTREALDAEVLDEDSEWEGDEGDWEEGQLPDITPLAPEEADELLPIIPSPEQMGQTWGGAVDFGQRAAAALVLTIVVAKFNLVLLATGSATSVFWGPVLSAANRNRILRNSGRFVGLWRASVVEVQIDMPERRSYGGRQSYQPLRGNPSLRLLVGDDSGARSQLTLPYNRRYEGIQVGEAAEVLVLSPQAGFNSFKALKEIYLPESGLWLSDYPHVNRNLFLEISLEIERERKMTMAEGAYEMPVS